MSGAHRISPWLRRFFTDYITTERNLSINTRRSYRDIFIILVPYMKTKTRKSPEHLSIPDLSVRHLRSFLNHIETEHGCSMQTRKLRLSGGFGTVTVGKV